MVPEIKVNTVVTVWRALKYSNIRVAAFRELSIINICLSGFVLSSIKKMYIDVIHVVVVVVVEQHDRSLTEGCEWDFKCSHQLCRSV